MTCEHTNSYGVVFDDRFPILEHAQCAECQHTYKTWGSEHLVPVTKSEVLKWWNRVLLRKGRYHEVVEIA